MSEIGREVIAQLAVRVFEARRQYYELIDAGIEQELGPPASEEELSAFEASIGVPLPPSYRLLLSVHNGWKHWEGDIHLLSIGEMQEGPFADWVREWKKEAADDDDEIVVRGLVVAAELHAGAGLILDLEERDEDGECPIINWEHGPRGRYRSFAELMADDADEWESLVREESGTE